jgi:hypothetical protein
MLRRMEWCLSTDRPTTCYFYAAMNYNVDLTQPRKRLGTGTKVRFLIIIRSSYTLWCYSTNYYITTTSNCSSGSTEDQDRNNMCSASKSEPNSPGDTGAPPQVVIAPTREQTIDDNTYSPTRTSSASESAAVQKPQKMSLTEKVVEQKKIRKWWQCRPGDNGGLDAAGN